MALHLQHVIALLALVASISSALSVDEISKMSLKEIRSELRKRKVSCDDCVEKEHFRVKLQEALTAQPEVSEESASTTEAEDGEKQPGGSGKTRQEKEKEEKKLSPEEEEQLFAELRGQGKKEKDLMEKLRKAGINAKMFDGNSFADFASKQKNKKKPFAKKERDQQVKASSPRRTQVDDDGSISDEL